MTDLYDQAAALPDALAESTKQRPLLTTGDLHAQGLSRRSISWSAHHGRLTHPRRGVYLPGPDELSFLDRLHAVSDLVPQEAMFAFHTAAALHGFGIVDSPEIHVTVPAGSPVPQIRGVAAHQHVVPIPESAEILGFRCVPTARCAIDLARTTNRMDALAILDATLRLGKIDDEGEASALRAEVALHRGRRGIRQVRELIEIADGRAECRQESHLRLVMHDAKLPPPVAQFGVLDEDGWVRYRIDLAYEEMRVGIEYDGSSHLDPRRLRLDRRRHNWLSSQGWSLRYFTAEDLYHRADLIVPTVRAALRSRRRSRGS